MKLHTKKNLGSGKELLQFGDDGVVELEITVTTAEAEEYEFGAEYERGEDGSLSMVRSRAEVVADAG